MKISVVIPVFNEGVTLGRCLESLRRQTLQANEIIVVDNNSTDASAEIATKYGARVVSEPKQGILPASYRVFSEASGDIIARCDADSILPADWLEVIVRELDKNPLAAGITGPGVFYGTNKLHARLAQAWYMYAYFLSVGSALANWPLFGSNCAIRRTVWLTIKDDIHLARTDIHDDIEISYHIPPSQKILFEPSLKVGISARALRAGGMVRRYKMAFRTISIHLPEQAPWRRWKQRITSS